MKCLRIFRVAGLLVSLSGLSLLAQTASSGSSASGTSAQPVSSVPASRVARLRRGINTSQWFAQVYDKRGYTKEHFQDWTTAQDIALIQAMGFDHVRLSVDPQPMMVSHRPGE